MRKTLIALLLAGLAAGGTQAAVAGDYRHCETASVATYEEAEEPRQCPAPDVSEPKAEPREESHDLPKRSHRVWTFGGELNDWNEGVLDVTVLRVGKHEFEEPTAVYVLVGERVRVYDRRGKRATQDQLGDAEHVAVRAKMLSRDDWRTDEDGEPVPTFRAKKVRITG